MKPEKEIRREILKQYGDRYNLKHVEFKVVIQDKIPEPKNIASNSAVLEFAGKIGKYFIYVIKTGYKTLKFICSLIAIYNLITIQIPKGYEFVENYGKQIFGGDTSAVREKGKDEDCYVVLRKSWIEDKGVFQQDYTNIQKGNFGTLNVSDAAYIPASGLSHPIFDGTNSSDKYTVTLIKT